MPPEVIVKLGTITDCTGEPPRSIPDVRILGNREGLRELARLLLWMSKRKPTDEHIKNGDPDDHQHFSAQRLPFNSSLSDELEFRIGILTDANRGAVLNKYGIKPDGNNDTQTGTNCNS
jgi:hypothetical protein